jgi:acylphosphatase
VIARRIVVEGRVQGVGFRDAMCTSAHIHRVRGWVRNRRDGRVEALVQGDDEAVALVIAWARRGPPAARVDRIDIDEARVDEGLRGFAATPTV